MNPIFVGATILGASLVLSGCQKAPDAPDPIRPVLTKTLALEAAPSSRFAGEVAPRFETDLSFRIFGRVIDRSIEVGDFVVAGQQIAQLDATTQQLSVRSAEASLASATAQLNNLMAVEQRQRSLLDRNTIASSEFESAAQASRSGESAVAQAKAQLDKAREQLGYATLRADAPGLVTDLQIDRGQTVAIGQTVATIVRPESRDAVISVLESIAGNLHVGDRFAITKQLDPSVVVPGTIREIAPQADATTRTVAVKIALSDPTESFKLGSTIVAVVSDAAPDQLALPATAVVESDGGAYVWIVDTTTQTVSKRRVSVTARDGLTLRATSGVSAGDIVVIAGAHTLEDGQKVRLDEGIAP